MFNETTRHNIIEAIKREFGAYIHEHWNSGSMVVYPFTFWQHELAVQLKGHDKRHFQQRKIDKIVAAFPNELKNGIFWQNDGSCPNELIFYYNEN